MTSKEIIAKAKLEIGSKESPANSNNVKYNTWYYGKPVSGAAYPWCCTFIAWLFQNEQRLCLKTASCEGLYNWFKSKNQLVKDPQPGDIVFFKYNTANSVRNNRFTNHVGLVEAVAGKSIRTIEGNTSVSSNDNGGAVMERLRTANIVAYARPLYSDTVREGTNVFTTKHPTLRLGSKGPDVVYLQLRLIALKYNPGAADGDFGKNTQEAVKKFQKDHKLTPDGVVGPLTWAQIGD